MRTAVLVLMALAVPMTAVSAVKNKAAATSVGETAGMAGLEQDYAVVINTMAMVDRIESENAAPEYVKAFEKYSREPEAIYRLRVWQDWPSDLEQGVNDALKGWVKANEGALDALKAGSSKDFFWLMYPEKTPLGKGPLASYTQVNSLATAMCWRAKIKASEGDAQGAVEDVLAAYRFGAHISMPVHRLWEQITGFTIQTNAMWTASMILSRTKMDGASLADLQNELQDMVDVQKFYYDTKADRVVVNEAIDRTFDDGNVSQNAVDSFKRNLNLSQGEVERWMNLEELRTLVTSRRLFGYFDLNISRTPGDIEFNKVDLKGEITSRIGGNVLLEKFSPDVLKDYELPFKTKAEADAVITICAIKRYELEKTQVAPTLKVLVLTGYLKAEPMDPFRDNFTMTYVPMGNTFKLYSYGANYKNDFATVSKWSQGKDGDQVFWPVE